MAVSSKYHKYTLEVSDLYPGMAVRVHDLDWYKSNRDENGVVKSPDPRDVDFIPAMAQKCGRVVHIEEINSTIEEGILVTRIHLDESFYAFSAYMFECIVDE